MLFGVLKPAQLKKINLKFPADPIENKITLKKSKSELKLYLGCSIWGRPEWAGKIYPEGTKEKDFLKYYARHYGSIELNATNHKIYPKDKLREWAKQVENPQFKFCPKAHRGMSFLKHSPLRESLTKDFIHSIRAFGNQLGPIFITHNEKVKWDAQSEQEFFEYLAFLPSDLTYFVEERWPAFFADKKLKARYYARLREMRIGTVITDTPGRRDVLNMQLTIPKTFLRFVGGGFSSTDHQRIDQWASRFRKWINEGIEEIYFFMHARDEGKTPELTQYVVESLNNKCKLNIPEVRFVK